VEESGLKRSSRQGDDVVTAPIYQVKAEFFKTLGHPARIRILEVLRDGERAVSELIPAVDIESSHLSQQLGILRRANLVRARKEGTSVVYSVVNPMLFELFDVAKKILTSSLLESRDLLAELESVSPGPTADPTGDRLPVGRSGDREVSDTGNAIGGGPR
jgi:DNA-binding transcriptional ArsR family regulator